MVIGQVTSFRVEVSGNGTTGKLSELVTVYPNPTTGKVQVYFPTEEAFELSVFDVSGTLIQTQKVANGLSLEVDLSDKQSGLYFIQMVTEHEIIVQQIVKN